MRRRCGLAFTLATALACVAVLLSGCASSPTKGDWKSQKAYGAQMARRGFWREALFRFEKAASENPNDAEIQNDLAVAYESVGETARALAAYKKALELDPNNPKVKRNYARFAEYYTSVQRASSPITLSAPAASPTPAATPRPAAPGAPTPAATPAAPPEGITAQPAGAPPRLPAAAPAPTPGVPPPPK